MTNSSGFLFRFSFTADNICEYADRINAMLAVDIADLIETKPVAEQLVIFNALNKEKAVATFEYLSLKSQKEILNTLPSFKVANLLNALAPDDRTALLEQLPQDVVRLLLQYLSPKERAISIRLLGYPPDSVGRLMTPDYITVKMEWTVKEVLNHIREKGKDSETLNVIYAVDENNILIDDFRIRQFLLGSLDAKVSDLSDHKFIALKVNDDEEKAIQVFRKYDRVALPVIDDRGHLLGIVTIDDIIEVAAKEDTEDIQKFGGIEALHQPYMEVPFFLLIKKRIGWLSVLFIGESFTATAMGFFENEIAKAVVLALFVPLIISSGGNGGSQSSTLIIRAMALGEITMRDWWKVMRREILSGLLLGAGLGLIGFFRIMGWSYFSNIYGEHFLLVATTIFFALIGVVMWGTLLGAMLPIVLKRLGFDPAVSSAPFVATLVDVTGLVIYFSVAMVILKGTLL